MYLYKIEFEIYKFYKFQIDKSDECQVLVKQFVVDVS